MKARVFVMGMMLALLAACAQEPGQDGAAATATPDDTSPAVVQDLDSLLAAADPAAGKRLYILCQSCHSINEGGINKIGPNLYGIMGQPSAAVAGFVYSPALEQAALTWDAATMDTWLQNPARLVPGTTMVFPGVPDAVQRAALIAYLRAAGTN